MCERVCAGGEKCNDVTGGPGALRGLMSEYHMADTSSASVCSFLLQVDRLCGPLFPITSSFRIHWSIVSTPACLYLTG